MVGVGLEWVVVESERNNVLERLVSGTKRSTKLTSEKSCVTGLTTKILYLV